LAEVALRAEPRTGTGKGPARRLRARGRIPAVLYGHGIEPVPVDVDAHALMKTLTTDAGANVLIDLEVSGSTHLTLARSVERHPVRGDYIHVDFLKISRDQVITIDVPIHFDGESRGVKEGGVLEHHLWQVHAQCLPGNVPERINVDISGLEIGDALRVSDLVAPEGVEILTDVDEVIVSCVVPQAPQLEAEVAAPEAAAEGEPAAETAAPAEGGQES